MIKADGLSGRGVEWLDVQALLATETATPMGRDRAQSATPLVRVDAVVAALEETTQARAALATGGRPPWQSVPDVRPALLAARAEGAVLEGRELALFVPLLEAAARLRLYGAGIRAPAPVVARLAESLPPLPDLRAALHRALAEDGSLNDGASPLLRRLRTRIRDLERRIVRDLESLLQTSAGDTLFADRFVTRRNGRYVVPVRADARARIRGIIHDRSQSGQTVFVEPDRVIEANNDLVEALREAELEALRILAELTEQIRRHALDLGALLASMAELDWIVARAALAERMNATCPVPGADRIALRGATHPLLLAQSWRDPGHPVVPIDLGLTRERPILIVTGPNAGGKTVALKTLGLLVLMTQVGCHLPAREGSELPLFSGLFSIIGDEQSVAENLSTFSAFVRQIREVLTQVDARTLVLLDELGAGTDPDEGAALAQALVTVLADRGAFVMATTHLDPLKAFASTDPRARNASVEFDEAQLAPTFRLAYDHPGQSYALAIAARLGLPPEVIADAQSRRTEQAIRLSELLARLDVDARLERERRLAAERDQAEAAMARAAAAAELDRAREQVKALLSQAKRDAAQLVTDVRRAVAEEWERLRRAPVTRRTLEDARQRLREVSAATTPAPVSEAPPAESLEPGDTVEAHHLGLRGQLQSIAGGMATVQSGAVTIRVPIHGLRKAAAATPTVRVTPRVPEKHDVPPQLLLLGRTSDEARDLVQKYLDDAFLAGLSAVRLVHGKGSGALRKAVQELLAGHPLVDSFRAGEPHEGGAGATVAALRID